MLQRLALLSILAIGMVWMMSAGLTQLDAEDRPFSFSLNPDSMTSILEIVSAGGMSALPPTRVVLWGDGRLQRMRGRDDEAFVERTKELTWEETNRLIDVLVSGGLLEWDHEEIRARMRKDFGSVPGFTDMPVMTLRLQVDRYVDSSGAEHESMSTEIRSGWPACVIERFADKVEGGDDFSEFRALCYLARYLNENLYKDE